MKAVFKLLLLVFLIPAAGFSQSLKVHESGRYLTTPDDAPFLWIGDTAWELFHKLDREEATEYLQNRKEKGFTVIQAVVLAENDGLRTPNPYGDLPLIDLDPTRPNEAYFEHVDFIVNEAERLGLFIGMLPTWGDKVPSANPGAGPIVFNPENAKAYGEFLGRRYHDKPIVWILGGDRNILNEEVLEIWQQMAAGIKAGDKGQHLMTYHPRGASSSSYFFHNEPWLDFNMYQSSHARSFNNVYSYAEHDRLLMPAKPTLDGEPAYEDIAKKFWDYMDFNKKPMERVPSEIIDETGMIVDRAHFEEGYFTGHDVRVHAYWNFLAGACGYTYGNNAIWQMFKGEQDLAIPCLYDWRTSMDRPGAAHMRHVHDLFTKFSFAKLIPDQSLVYGVNREGKSHIRAAIADDASFALVYLGAGQMAKINMSKFPNGVNASWFNPREGTYTDHGKIENMGITELSPPSSGPENDWMLVLEVE